MATHPTFAQVCDKAIRLPCSPALLPRLTAVLQRENAPMDELEAVICLDPGLATSTLRLANSAFYGAGSAQVDNLGEALMRLGQKEVFRVAALSVASRWMDQKADGYHWEPGDFCRLSLVAAVAAEYLAETTGQVDPKTAYTAGLIHEIGKLAIAYTCSAQFPEIRKVQAAASLPWLVAEKQVLGYNYAKVGAELLRRWKFSPALIAVGTHNPPKLDSPSEFLPLLAHIHAAKYLAVTIGAGVAEDGFLFELNVPLLTEAGFSPEMLEASVPEVVDRASKLLREKLTHGSLSF